MTFHGLFWRELSSLAPQAETIAKPTNKKIIYCGERRYVQ
jgi:hypothetical protein